MADKTREYVAFCQRLTRWGESGVYGFLSHLDSRPAATLLTQSIATEARQQMIFRQFSGAHPMPVFFEVSLALDVRSSTLLIPPDRYQSEHGLDPAESIHHFLPR